MAFKTKNLAAEIRRAIHHCLLHPMRSLYTGPELEWVTGLVSAYDEAPDGEGTDAPTEKGWSFAWFLHHALAHPLLVLCPRLGEPLHTWTGERL